MITKEMLEVLHCDRCLCNNCADRNCRKLICFECDTECPIEECKAFYEANK